MMQRRKVVTRIKIGLYFIILACSVSSQIYGNLGSEIIHIPFDLTRNKIILPVQVNNSKSLKIILDTGKPTSGLTLFDRRMGKALQLESNRKQQIHGAGKGKGTFAMVVEPVMLSLAEMDIQNQRVLILESDALRGADADGVIGGTLFNSYVVGIDYDERIVTIRDPSEFEADPSWKVLPLTFNENRIPFIDAIISIKGRDKADVSLYIDLASSEALVMLVKPDMKFNLPRALWGRYTGRGINGYFFGKFGYIFSLKLGPYVLNDIPTAFPKDEMRSRQENADGLIGNKSLRRFNVIFDYSRKKLYLKPNNFFSMIFR